MSIDASMFRLALRTATISAAAAGGASAAQAGDARDLDRIRQAIAYLEDRQKAWSRFPKAQRGEGADSTSCVSCHTGISYALARPALGRFVAGDAPATPMGRMIAAEALRVEHWAELDSPRFRLMYDGDERKKAESRGTEAVFDALILARRCRGRPGVSRRGHAPGVPAPLVEPGEGRQRRRLLGLDQFRPRALGGRQLAHVRGLPGRDRRRLGPRVSRPPARRGSLSGRRLAPQLPPPTVPRGEPVQPPLVPRGVDDFPGPAVGRSGSGGLSSTSC
jgi:hypothetical protein